MATNTTASIASSFFEAATRQIDSFPFKPANYLSAWPEELIMATMDFLQPECILNFGLTSRRHHKLIVDDRVWLPITVELMEPHVDPGHLDIPLHDLLVQNRKQLSETVNVGPNVHNTTFTFIGSPAEDINGS